jgi:HlyD family secretion protein
MRHSASSVARRDVRTAWIRSSMSPLTFALRRPTAVLIAVAGLLAAGGAGTGYVLVHGKGITEIVRQPQSEAASAAARVSVKTASPRPGGLDRLCTQPGSVEPFEAADLYSKVSGFLVEQNVDIG